MYKGIKLPQQLRQCGDYRLETILNVAVQRMAKHIAWLRAIKEVDTRKKKNEQRILIQSNVDRFITILFDFLNYLLRLTWVSCSAVDSVATLANPSSYLSKAVNLSKRLWRRADTSCLAAASTAATFCVIARTWPMTLSSRKSYGKVSVHSAKSCTSLGTKRWSLSCWWDVWLFAWKAHYTKYVN